MKSIIGNTTTSIQTYARVGGLLYLVIIAAGFSSEFFFRGKLIVAGDFAATSKNILESPILWRCGIALEFVCIICTVVLAMVYYYLLRPVHKELNLLAAFFRMVSIPMQAVSLLFLIEALLPITQKAFMDSFTIDQLYKMSYLSIRAHAIGYNGSLLVLGFCFLIHGYLISTSEFLPRTLGILIQLAGVAYIVHSFVYILAPSLTRWTFPVAMLPVLIGETTLSIWLTVKGVDVDKWKLKQAEMD